MAVTLFASLGVGGLILKKKMGKSRSSEERKLLKRYLNYPAPVVIYKNNRLLHWNKLAQRLFINHCDLAQMTNRVLFFKWLDRQVVWCKQHSQYLLQIQNQQFRKKVVNTQQGLRICYYVPIENNSIMEQFEILSQRVVAPKSDSKSDVKTDASFELDQVFSQVLLQSFATLGSCDVKFMPSPAVKVRDNPKVIQDYLEGFVQILRQGINPQVPLYQVTAAYQVHGNCINFQFEIGHRLKELNQQLFEQNIYRKILKLSHQVERKVIPCFETRYLDGSNYAVTRVSLEMSLNSVLQLGREARLD